MKFNARTITDNVHGSIGISELEQQIINTREFQRLKKIKHLGLAFFVFPGAEHSRFAHSIGVLRVMAQMLERLEEEGCPYLDERTKQTLRLAALLHDVGHFPLSHAGEHVFKWVDYEQNVPDVMPSQKGETKGYQLLLLESAKQHKSDAASHEKLGELILTHNKSRINKILIDNGDDPAEIARIFNAEERKNPFYVQLISSTLDCDRMDYMLRDAIATGTSYGHIDLDYILRNVEWDQGSELICYSPKAITAIEHFITNRYFEYNIIYHKTILGFEMMATALFFAMIMEKSFNEGRYGGIVHSFDGIAEKMDGDDDFLPNFNDEYFWYYLERFQPTDPILRQLKQNLLNRVPLRPIYEIRTHETKTEGYYDKKYILLTSCLADNKEFVDELTRIGLNPNYISMAERKIKFEALEHSVEIDELAKIADEDRLKLVKIKYKDGNVRELITDSGSIIRLLSKCSPCIARLYALVEKGSSQEANLKSFVHKFLATKGG